MLAAERKRWILELLRQHGKVEVQVLARQLQVSLATIRRDLLDLEQNGLLFRTHGGALARNYAGPDLPYLVKAGHQVPEKQRIAKRAVQLLQDGDTIILDAGSTTREVARVLDGLRDVTVVTHDLNISLELADKPGLHVYQTGGAVQPLLYSTVGVQTVEAYKSIKVNKAFLGADALHSTEGLMTRSMDRAAIKTTIARSASQVIVVADHTKMENLGVFRAVQVEEIDLIITSAGVDPSVVERFEARGVRVEVV